MSSSNLPVSRKLFARGKIICPENLIIISVFFMGYLLLFMSTIDVGKISAKTTNISIKKGLLNVIFFNVGQGDSILIVTPDEKYMLIDAGETDSRHSTFNAGKEVVAPFLEKENIDYLDIVLMTHAHSDHIGGLGYIVNNFKIGAFFDPKYIHTTNLYERLIKSVINHSISYHTPKPDELVLNLGEKVFAQVMGFNPEKLYESTRDDCNNNSLVVRLSYNDISFLLTGDIEKEAEKNLLDYGKNIRSTFLKIPHHGAHESNSEKFIKFVSPKFGIVQVGKGNSFGHPHPDTMKRYQDAGVEVFRTDFSGTIQVVTDGIKYKIYTERD